MKVLFGSFSAITVLGGGVERQVSSLAKALTEKGVRVELFDSWKKYNLKEYRFFHLFGANVGTYHLGRALKNLGMKLIVTPIFYSRSSPKSLKFKVNCAVYLRKLGGFWTEHSFCRELCELADIVIVNTAAELKLMKQGLEIPESKMHIVPNGVDKHFVEASPELFIKEYGIKDFVLYVGHIGSGRKNVLPLIKVLRQIGVNAVLIGPVLDNAYGKECVKIISETPSIKLIPGLAADSPILKSAYAACDTFILPSFYETPGLAALEAGLAGAKICITKYGGTTEYFGEHATYIEPQNEKSIQSGLLETISKQKTPALRYHILENFTWEKCAEKLINIYQQIGLLQ